MAKTSNKAKFFVVQESAPELKYFDIPIQIENNIPYDMGSSPRGILKAQLENILDQMVHINDSFFIPIVNDEHAQKEIGRLKGALPPLFKARGWKYASLSIKDKFDNVTGMRWWRLS